MNPAPTLQHTLGHLDCPACKLREAQRLSEAAFGQLPFKSAAPAWLDEHSLDIKQHTLTGYNYHIRALSNFFSELPLNQIHSGHFESYIDEREKDASGSTLRHEFNVLSQILNRGHLWKGSKLETEYALIRKRRLKLKPSPSGEVLSADTKERLIAVASSHPRWKVALWGTVLTLTTTADMGEITHLHLGDIDPFKRTMRIREGLKNLHRDRIVTLNNSAWAAVELILGRYYKLCQRLNVEADPEHYILPGRLRAGRYDLWKPMGSWRKAWDALRIKAELPRIRKKALRRQPITELLEDKEISEQVVLELAGHVTKGMQNRYSEIRLEPKRKAVEKLEIPLFLALVENVEKPESIGPITRETKAEQKT